MKFLFLFLLAFSVTLCNGQSDIDFSMSTQVYVLYTEKPDTLNKDTDGKPLVKKDTTYVTEGSLRYINKKDNNLTVYDPLNPTAVHNYKLEYAGWIWPKTLVVPIIRYNIIDDKKQRHGAITINLYGPECFIETSIVKIHYLPRI